MYNGKIGVEKMGVIKDIWDIYKKRKFLFILGLLLLIALLELIPLITYSISESEDPESLLFYPKLIDDCGNEVSGSITYPGVIYVNDKYHTQKEIKIDWDISEKYDNSTNCNNSFVFLYSKGDNHLNLGDKESIIEYSIENDINFKKFEIFGIEPTKNFLVTILFKSVTSKQVVGNTIAIEIKKIPLSCIDNFLRGVCEIIQIPPLLFCILIFGITIVELVIQPHYWHKNNTPGYIKHINKVIENVDEEP